MLSQLLVVYDHITVDHNYSRFIYYPYLFVYFFLKMT